MKDTVQNGWETIHIENDSISSRYETVATEFPLTILINGEEFATIVCTPRDLRNLTIGFIASEGIIRTSAEIKSIHTDEKKGFAYVEIAKSLDGLRLDHSKRFISSCCGKSRQFYFKSDAQTAMTVTSQLSISIAQCNSLMSMLENDSTYFKQTGGVHNAALCTTDEIITTRTDIGRHNALDKIYGHILEERLVRTDKLIAFSGRISSEVLLKLSKIGIGIIISKSAPTDLALKLAIDLNITVIGFARGKRMNIYTHPYRIMEAVEFLNKK